MKKIKMQSKLFIKGKLHTLTGLHIGGNSGGLKIGGADSVVVRSPLKDNEPYIPGSSLKGKMRALLERTRGPEVERTRGPEVERTRGPEDKNLEEGGYSKKSEKAGPGTKGNSLLGQIFGVSAGANNTETSPTRLIVRDCFLSRESARQLKEASNTDMPMTEVKTEVSIDRITSKANPREFERVPAGSEFEIEIILTLFEGDDPDKFLSIIFEALDLIEDDSLGGSGSRGYGKVCFKEFCITKKEASSYKGGGKEGEKFEYDIPQKFKNKLFDPSEEKAG